MPVNAVIFDIGNVLIEWNPERFFDSTIGEARRRVLFEQVDLHDMNDEVDKGGNFRKLVHAKAAATPEFTAEIMLWHDHWLEMASPVIPGSIRCLRALRAKGVPVFALSNFGIQTFDLALSVYRFLEEFDRSYISGHMGVIKPDPEIYRRVEEDCGLDPTTLLFADDRADNIAMADARGWQTHLFDGPQGWGARLIAEGLVTAEDIAP